MHLVKKESDTHKLFYYLHLVTRKLKSVIWNIVEIYSKNLKCKCIIRFKPIKFIFHTYYVYINIKII